MQNIVETHTQLQIINKNIPRVIVNSSLCLLKFRFQSQISLPPDEESDFFLRFSLSYNHDLHIFGLKATNRPRIDLIFWYLLQKRNTNFASDQNFQAEKNYPAVDWVKK